MVKRLEKIENFKNLRFWRNLIFRHQSHLTAQKSIFRGFWGRWIDFWHWFCSRRSFSSISGKTLEIEIFCPLAVSKIPGPYWGYLADWKWVYRGFWGRWIDFWHLFCSRVSFSWRSGKSQDTENSRKSSVAYTTEPYWGNLTGWEWVYRGFWGRWVDFWHRFCSTTTVL